MGVCLVLTLLVASSIHDLEGGMPAPSLALFSVCFFGTLIWLFITYLAVVDQEEEVRKKLCALRDTLSGTERCILYERRWAEELAYEQLRQHQKGEGGIFIGGMHQTRVLNYGMNFIAWRIWEASKEADYALAMQGRDSPDHQDANDTVKRFLERYWEMAELLQQKFGRPKKESWKEDLPQDVIKAEAEKQSKKAA